MSSLLLLFIFTRISVALNSTTQWLITDIQSMDGSGNNLEHPLWGAAGQPYLRITPVQYGPNQSPTGANRPNARNVSNTLFGQKPFLQNTYGISDFAPAWGVMLHLDLTFAATNSSDPFPIPVSSSDPVFNFPNNPENFIPVFRAGHVGVDVESNMRVIPNAFTPYIDCSGLYGNSIADMNNMRSFIGGKLKSVNSPMGEFPPRVVGGPYNGYFAFNIPNINMMPRV
ncbi:hypothetical protein HK100_003739 [Physocladia obscura]|uniref:Uncharacterized protein n=1 Tax=Physocladia obscura TaxID=109957 RepID=A0AAD5SV84_9FUNG|nr:hypothetical protein HK100_003739 [Physocladia obscura]